MSLNVLNGYSDVLSRFNLATNGSFRINQRANFLTLTPCTLNDYIADCWYIGEISTDYCEAIQHPNGYLQFQGYGKKGQLIKVVNRDDSTFGLGGVNLNSLSDRSLLTSACIMKTYDNSVPLKLSTIPRYHTTGDIVHYSKEPQFCKFGQGMGVSNSFYEAVSVVETMTHSIDTKADITITLQADGEFNFYISNFRELSGGFRNPSSDVFTPIADDQLRCEMYYQEVGISTWNIYPMTYTNGTLETFQFHHFRTKMAGTPSISISNDLCTIYQNAADGTGSTTTDQSNWTFSGDQLSNKGFRLIGTRNAYLSSRSTIYLSFDWRAEIA